ncbi:MAG: MFS transporter [Ancalomicrobiaceae bacterium]|nr:MFS transporter [Ancalomicrobiaceae bacterium]
MRFLDVRKDEYGKVALTWLMSALLAMGYAIGWAAVHSMLVKRLGVEFLPYAYIGISLLGMFGSSVYLMFADSVRRDRLLIAFAAVTATALALSRFLVQERHVGEAELSTPLVLFFAIVLLTQGVGNSTLGTQVWTIIGDVFRPSQGRRLYPIIGTSGTIGGILGGLSINALLQTMGTANLVLVWAASIALLIPTTLILQRRFGGELKGGRRAEAGTKESRMENLRVGARFFFSSSLMQVISGIAVMFWVVGSLQDFQYTRIMSATFPSEEALATYYGYYAIAFNISALVIQFGLARHVLSRIGIGGGLTVLPMAIMGMFAVLLVDFTFLPGLVMRYVWDIIGMTVQGNTFHLAFNGVPSTIRGRVRGFLEGMVNPLGGILGGLVILGLRQGFGSHVGGAFDVITLAGLAAAFLWVLISLNVKRSYMAAVVDNLGSSDRRTFLDAIECLEEHGNPQATARLMALLSSDDRAARATAMATLGRLSHLPALRPISRLLLHPDELVRLDAVRAIRSFRNTGKHPFLNHYLAERLHEVFSTDAAPAVRAEAARFLIEHRTPEEMPRFVADLLRNPDPLIRGRVVETLMALDLGYADFALERVYDDPDPGVRAALIAGLWTIPERHDDACGILVRLLAGADPAERLAGLRCIVSTGISDVPVPSDLLDTTDHETRVLAALALLAAEPEGVHVDRAVAIVLGELADTERGPATRAALLPLLPRLGEAGLDALLIGAMALPSPAKEAVAAVLGDFHDLLEKSLQDVD